MTYKIATDVDYLKIPGHNFVVEHCTSLTRPANPVAGQLVYETDTGCVLYYDGSANKWSTFSGGLKFKGTVGGSGTGALVNLPEDPDLQDAYIVGADGNYGPTGSEQYAQIGDTFFCAKRKTTTTPATWFLVPSGNGRLSQTVTIVDGTTTYTVPNTLGTTNCTVTVFDADGNWIVTGLQVTANSIIMTIDASASTLYAGQTFKIVVVSG